DLSVYPILILSTLSAGGTIVLLKNSAAWDPVQWAEVMAREEVTIWNSAPAQLGMLIEYVAGRPEVRLRNLRLTHIEGGRVPVALPERVRSLVKGVQVISGGCVTEAIPWFILFPAEEVGHDGRPMGNRRLRVLDSYLQPLPVGVTGALYIVSAGLSRGYLNRPDLTAEKLIPDPFSEEPGARLYKTGNL